MVIFRLKLHFGIVSAFLGGFFLKGFDDLFGG
jgi:hypothetical protein